ncbi:hypothetical protein WHR41_04553 [Cladosporium halotolerans]|uniref:Uncharacterized protein n=1 Tax=Cladosporium halotolerans TaxID=1052096 RepID=A0AB34KSF3_9PEZI
MFLSILAEPYAMSPDWERGWAIMQMAERVSLKDDLAVHPLPGELCAFAARTSQMSPGPFMPTAPLTQGKWTIVVCHGIIERRDPMLTKLRYSSPASMRRATLWFSTPRASFGNACGRAKSMRSKRA